MEYYNQTYQQLYETEGEVAALEIVARYQHLLQKHGPNWIIGRCKLLATYYNPALVPEPPLLDTMVSVFYRPVTNTKRQKKMSLRSLVNLIRGEAFKFETDHLRTIKKSTTGKKKDCPNNIYKAKNFCYATISGTFSKRKDIYLEQHSGVICIDIDNIGNRLQEVRSMLISDPATVVCFISPNGDGLKVVYAMDINQESQQWWYEGYCDYLATTYGLPFKNLDQQCSDVSRACFLPHDPTIFVNPHFVAL